MDNGYKKGCCPWIFSCPEDKKNLIVNLTFIIKLQQLVITFT